MPSRFLDSWRRMFAAATDAPMEFGEIAGLSVLSTLALNRRWLDYGKGGLRPNLFAMIVGDSSVARKSTSVALARAAVEEVDLVRVGPRDYTVEALLKWMNEKDPTNNTEHRNKLCLFAEEFGQDLGRFEAYGATAHADFCALYDGESFEKIRVKSGSLMCHKPRVGFLAAAAYPMLQKHLDSIAWLSGFLMRFIYVAPTWPRIQFDTAPKFPQAAWALAMSNLNLLLNDLKARQCSMQLTPRAHDRYVEICRHYKELVSRLGDVPKTYLARFQANLLKLSCLYQIDEYPGPDIDLPAVEQAALMGAICWDSFLIAHEMTVKDEWEFLYDALDLYLADRPKGVMLWEVGQRFRGIRGILDVVGHFKSTGKAAIMKAPGGGEMIVRLH